MISYFIIFVKQATPSDDGISFNCQHGKSECAGNKAHSCALHLAPNEEAAVKFAACAMSSQQYDKVIVYTYNVGVIKLIDHLWHSSYSVSKQPA